jgi:glucosyl-3-phosphoglycerate phosphatase
MTVLALLRHGTTEWNLAGRMQGRHDTALSAAARDSLAALRLPPELAGFAWLTSPLRRAAETAIALGIAYARPDPRLVEMDWGEWEGRTLAELRAQPADIMAADIMAADVMAQREEAGLDFKPPGGESPREVQLRLAPLLAELAQAGRPVGAVTHKGVIRAVLALATGWDLRGKAPARLDWHAVHLFRLDAAGHPAPLRLNLGLVPRSPP